ncbi:uncharacterized protein B0H64DRAFT_388156 [Chaetomium fimeti]|uniref:Uncharacterized protein n=1 Tax=Chaetomium fimeti TaxID=1854472 RepID=A0AAE0HMP3_9PEZI|nr:hypothetical protein B0H64DRAFT_388156 [Chaetomium fimeti]
MRQKSWGFDANSRETDAGGGCDRGRQAQIWVPFPSPGFIKRATINRRLHDEKRAGWIASFFSLTSSSSSVKARGLWTTEAWSLLVGSIRDEIRKRGPLSGGTDQRSRSSDPEIRQLATLRTRFWDDARPEWGGSSETPRAGDPSHCRDGWFCCIVVTLRRWRRMACAQQGRILLLLGWLVFDSSWAINIERSVMLRCDNAQGTPIRSTLVS